MNKFNLLFTLFFLYVITACNGDRGTDREIDIVASEVKSISTESDYDSVYAASLGADELGMKKYVMAFLKAGPNREQDSVQTVEIQRGHMKNIQRLAEEGKLILAGPFMDNGELRGIFLFDVKTVEEAEQLINTDPAIQSGRLIMELHPWYGSAALMEVSNIHERIAKENP